MQDDFNMILTDSSTNNMIICKPTKWFLMRALAMLLMFGIFTGLFIKDGLSGYKEKNLQFYMHQSFQLAGAVFDDAAQDDEITDGQWRTLAKAMELSFPENSEAVLPAGVDSGMALPDIVIEGYEVFKAQGGEQGAVLLWRQYTSDKKGWNEEPPKKAYDADNIRNQFVAAGVSGALFLIVLFVLLRTLGRSMKVDDDALYAQTGARIPYEDMVRIDKRKWDNKGLALVYYKQDGIEKKVKIDGMVYGQFREEEGAPAEKLFTKILENFKGDIVDYEVEDSST